MYDGAPGHPIYPAGSTAAPRNQYGVSKLAFEGVLRSRWPRHTVLRSSNMVGEPAPFTHVGKFLQWVLGQLRAAQGKGDQEAIGLFNDEFRCARPLVDMDCGTAFYYTCRPLLYLLLASPVDAVGGGHGSFWPSVPCRCPSWLRNPTNQPTDQPTNRPINQTTNQLTNQPTDQPTNQPPLPTSTGRLSM